MLITDLHQVVIMSGYFRGNGDIVAPWLVPSGNKFSKQLATIFSWPSVNYKSLQITLKNRYKLIELFSLYALECTGLYKACHKSGLPWLHCKSIINWMDGSSNSISHTLGAEVSASYVEHVLNTFYIPEEIEGRLLNIFIVSIYQSDFH